MTLEFLEDPTAGTLACHAAEGSADLTALQESAYQDLYLLKRLQFDAPLPWTSQSLWVWFISNVHKIQYLRGSNASYGAYVIHVPVNNASGWAPGRLPHPSGLVHEAAHGKGPHTCDWTRDRTISELGAWGVQYYFDLWVADHVIAPTLTLEERDYFRQGAGLLRASNAFCTTCGGI